MEGVRHRKTSADCDSKKGSVNLLLQRKDESSGLTIRKLLYIVVVALLFLWVFQSNFLLVGSHSHDHDHDHGHAHDHHGHAHDDSPSFKYSRQANEQLVIPSFSTVFPNLFHSIFSKNCQLIEKGETSRTRALSWWSKVS